MANLSLKNIPEDLYDRIRQSAREHRRSINSEILFTLEQALRSNRVDPKKFLEEVETIQRRIRVTPLTDELIRQAKEDGRE